jgi:hypothetical protein
MSSTQEVEVDGLSVGSVWYTSWGYDQTNVEFFEVVRTTGASIVLRRIGAEVQDGRLYPRPGEYVQDFHLQGNPGTPERLRDEARGYSEKMCRKPRTSPDGYQFSSVTIDDVRNAYPYEGGGKYDTYAAGQPGH